MLKADYIFSPKHNDFENVSTCGRESHTILRYIHFGKSQEVMGWCKPTVYYSNKNRINFNFLIFNYVY